MRHLSEREGYRERIWSVEMNKKTKESINDRID
jgi:hypothetical protein